MCMWATQAVRADSDVFILFLCIPSFHKRHGVFFSFSFLKVRYAIDTVVKVAENESAWNYIKGICAHVDGGLGAFPRIKEVALASMPHARCHVHALGTLLDIYCAEAIEGIAGAGGLARELCDLLAKNDDVRVAYWGWRKEALIEVV